MSYLTNYESAIREGFVVMGLEQPCGPWIEGSEPDEQGDYLIEWSDRLVQMAKWDGKEWRYTIRAFSPECILAYARINKREA